MDTEGYIEETTSATDGFTRRGGNEEKGRAREMIEGDSTQIGKDSEQMQRIESCES